MQHVLRSAYGQGNPYDPVRRAYLMQLYQARAITYAEAQQLQRMITEDQIGSLRRGDQEAWRRLIVLGLRFWL